MAIPKAYFPNISTGAAIRDGKGRVIDRQIDYLTNKLNAHFPDGEEAKTVDQLVEDNTKKIDELETKFDTHIKNASDKDIVGVVNGTSLIITLRNKPQDSEDIPKEPQPTPQAKPSGFSLEEEEPEESSFPVAQSKQTGGFTFTQQEEPKETTFSLSSAKPSGGFNFGESDSSNSFSLGGSKVSATGFEIKIS